MTDWIKCKDKLPEDQVRVLIFTKYKGDAIAKRCGNGDWYLDKNDYLAVYHANEVTHWMPLPNDPEE